MVRMGKVKVRDGKESVVHTRFRTAAEKVAAQGTVEDHYGTDKMVTCAHCGKVSFLARRHGPADGAVPDNVYMEQRDAAREAVQPTAAEVMVFVAAEAAHRDLTRALASLAELRARLHKAKGRPGFDRLGVRVVVGQDEALLAEGPALEAEAQTMLLEAEARYRAAGAARSTAERALSCRRSEWIAAQEQERTAAQQAKGDAAGETRRAGLRDRIAAVVARKE